METNVIKKGSAIRRSLMALAVLAAPVVSVAGFSGSTSAITVASTGPTPPSGFAVIDCAANGSFIDVQITGDTSSLKFDVLVDGVLTDVDDSAGNINSHKILEDKLVEGKFYYVQVLNEDGSVLFGTTLAVNCFSEDVSCAIVSNPIVTVMTPDANPDSELFDVSLYTTKTDLTKDSIVGVEIENKPELTPVGLPTGGNGTFLVEVDGNGKTIEFLVLVSCNTTGPVNPNFGKKVGSITPVIPQTGPTSNSLLVVAPMMVLLGGALIVARRRLANA